MHMRLVAVGDRQPAWIDTAYNDYAARLPRAWKFTLQTIATSKRRKHGDAAAAKQEESERILAALRNNERAVMLDESGKQMTSTDLATKVTGWQSDGRDICFIIGGPDGIDQETLQQAEFRWSLSKLTLPHGLARVLCVEQLYRACALNDGHPYHRA